MKLKLKNQTLHIQVDEAIRVLDILNQLNINRKLRYLLFQNQCIQYKKAFLKQDIMLQKQESLYIHMPVFEEDDILPSFIPIDVIYEDELLLVVNKPAHLIVHSDGTNDHDTLCNRVKAYYMETNQYCTVRPIHRLDKETTGLLMFCKIPFLQPLLDSMLESKQISREYEAIIQGNLLKSHTLVTKAIGRDRHNASKMRISSTGKYAKTTFDVLQTYSDYSLVHCRLETGRTHQIRVHLADLGHPILSDTLYGYKDNRIPRLALHAGKLTFYHILLGKQMILECPLPKDMKKLLK